jgi:putative membrane protein
MTQILLLSLNILLHIYFLIFEMFLWKTPKIRKQFQMTEEFAKESAKLAANQGLYNGFLAVGLAWGLCTSQFEIKIFFLTCMLVAGIFGGFTANKKIFYVQALPALLGLISLLFLSSK